MEYPFRPKSTKHLIPGQFWAIPVQDRGFACGRVIALSHRNGKQDTRLFLAGLLDWSGGSLPDSVSIAGSKTIAQGQAHIKTILESGGTILGHRSLDADGIEPELFLSEAPGRNCMLVHGTEVIRRATVEEQATLPVFAGWGYHVMTLKARKILFAESD